MRKGTNEQPIISEAPAWKPFRNFDDPSKDLHPTDSIGAGDTFVAGMLYGMFVQGGVRGGAGGWNNDQRLNFANELAGRKVYQEGFKGLGEAIRKDNAWRALLNVVSAQNSPAEESMD